MLKLASRLYQAILNGTTILAGRLEPDADAARNIGTTSRRVAFLYTTALRSSAESSRLSFTETGNSNYHRGAATNGATAIAHRFGNTAALSTAGAKIAAFYSDDVTTEKASVSCDGMITVDGTDASGTPGAATINKPSGQVAVANGVSSVVVTNALVAATSKVFAVLQDNTDAIEIRSVVPAAGSFTINLTGNTSAARKVGFVVFG